MTDLEDRLRQDFRKLADRAQPGAIRPLGIPAPSRRGSIIRWLAPITAVAAVVGVIAGISLAGGAVGHRQAETAAQAGMPPYYVTLNSQVIPPTRLTITATVRSSANGAVLAIVPVVHYRSGQQLSSVWITGAADDRTFAITDGEGLFVLHIAANGRSARLSRVPVRMPFTDTEASVISPDGQQVAVYIDQCATAVLAGRRTSTCHQGIAVVSVATGTGKVWLTPGTGVVGGFPIPFSPSWVNGGRTLLFRWNPVISSNLGLQPDDYRLLNISGPAGDLFADSRPTRWSLTLPRLSPASITLFPAAFLTPDGSAVVTTDYRIVPSDNGGGTITMRVIEISARTSRLIRVLHRATLRFTRNGTSDPELCVVLSLGPRGLHALVQCPGLGRLDGSTFTPLPGPSANVDLQPANSLGGIAAW
jgi:hypothetical protein